ncbi:hypothetical protein L211DRAFT_836681 [Terfezia boudieri ATCC MYA-4762]|uniref:Uncharacterized protein n=1 Tax=Terfezia boudieri ATCC MYA-4762 TaxID=1051890 RepID=A0A3N4LUV0_9PEZI|nr:hypothetical protein L211DRAFT_836681 [Terfezia boudieri ATCC MYA-4762]
MPRLKEVSHPFLNTTYSLHRVSPLYKFPTLNPSEHLHQAEQSPKQRSQSPFKAHERALTNLLKGEVLRGVNVSRWDASFDGENAEMAKLGRFKGCKWCLVPTLAALREYSAEQALREVEDNDDEEEEDMERVWAKAIRGRGDVAGVEVSFDYERGLGGYVAYLIGPPQKEDGEFTKLPLVLTRLPKLLVDVLFEYLAATFDTLALSMGVTEGTSGMGAGNGESVGWLGEMLEMYVEQMKGRVDKGIALTYRIPTGLGSGVKVITAGLEKGDISGFLSYGMALGPRMTRNGKKRKREGNDDAEQSKRRGPFLLAVERHMESTMSLDATKLTLTKVTCGGFIVGGAPSGATIANGDGKKATTEAEATEPSGRVKIFVRRKGQIKGADGDEDQGAMDGRSGEEAAAEKFMDELIQLAIRKGGIANYVYANGGDDGRTSNVIEPKQTTGKILRG